ncbi:hypothetical protein QOT17_003961 [Balamuthia mandrillaris]
MTMRLQWTIREEGSNSGNGSSDDRIIELALESSATGWSAIGLSADGTMTSSGRGSDVMLGWISDPIVMEEGDTSAQGPANRQEEDCSSGCLHDYWVERKFPSPPVMMDEQWGEGGRADLLLVAAEEADGMTSFEWDRALDTGDTVADRVIDPSVETFGKNKCPGIGDDSLSGDSTSASSLALDPLPSDDTSTPWSSPSSSASSGSTFDDSISSSSSYRDHYLLRFIC